MLLPLILTLIGVLLIFSAIKHTNPLDTLKNVLGGK